MGERGRHWQPALRSQCHLLPTPISTVSAANSSLYTNCCGYGLNTTIGHALLPTWVVRILPCGRAVHKRVHDGAFVITAVKLVLLFLVVLGQED